jgi:hypothetical protein
MLVFLIHSAVLKSFDRSLYYSALTYSVVLFILLLIVHLQRSLGIFVLGALVIHTGLVVIGLLRSQGEGYRPWRRSLLTVLLVVVVPASLYQASRDQVCLRCTSNGVYRWLFWYNDPSRATTFDDTKTQKPEMREMAANTRVREFGLSRIGSEWYQDPGGMVTLYVRKLQRLVRVGDNMRWQDRSGHGYSPRLTGISSEVRPTGHIHRIAAWILATLGLYVVIARGIRGLAWWFPVLFWFIFSSLMLLGFVQVRYTYPNMMVLALLGGIGTSALVASRGVRRTEMWIPLRWAAAGTLAAVLMVAAAGSAFAYYWPKSNYFLHDLHRPLKSTPGTIKPTVWRKRSKLVGLLRFPQHFFGNASAVWKLRSGKMQRVRVEGMVRIEGEVEPSLHLRLTANRELVFDGRIEEMDGSVIQGNEAWMFMKEVDTGREGNVKLALDIDAPPGSFENRGMVGLEFVRLVHLGSTSETGLTQ